MSDFNADRFNELGTLIASMEPNEDQQQVLIDWVDNRTKELKDAENASSGSADAQRQATAIAKGLPLIATGIQGAIKGFKGGDPIAGSAAVVDVVGSMVTMISAMISTSAGPPGAVVGSILSIFSMMLKSFSNQKPEKSVEQKLQNVIDVNDANDLEDTLQGIQIEINSVIDGFTAYSKKGEKYEFSKIQNTLGVENKGLLLSKAGEWIKKNQYVQHWEAVLAAHFYAHISLMQALTMAMNIVKTNEDIRYLTGMLIGQNSKQLAFIQAVKPTAQDQGTIWTCLDRKFANMITGAGIYKEVGGSVTNKNKNKKEVQKYIVSNTPLSFAVSNRKTDAGSGFREQSIAVFTLDNAYTFGSRDWVGEKTTLLDHPFRKDVHAPGKKSVLSAMYGFPPLRTNTKWHTLVPFNSGLPDPGYFDIWAIPGHNVGEINLYIAEGNLVSFRKQGSKEHTGNVQTKLITQGWSNMPEGYKVGAVRAVEPKPFEDEQNTLAIVPNHTIYGACEVLAKKTKGGKVSSGLLRPTHYDRDHMEIYVMYREIPGSEGSIQKPINQFMVAPWPNFVGIGVDSRYFWVYKAGAIACATHTEVYDCLAKGGNAQPPWMVYKIPNKVGEIEYDPNELGYVMGRYFTKGLLDLSPCDDGTLVALYAKKDSMAAAPLYSMTPKIDRVARTLKIEGTKRDSNNHIVSVNGWIKLTEGIRYNRVIKQQIECWPLLVGLEKILVSMKKTN